MNKEVVSQALENIDASYIEEAADYSAKRRRPALIGLAAAACIAAALLIAVPALSSGGNTLELSDASSGVKVKYGDPDEIVNNSYSLAYFYTEEELFSVFDTDIFKGTVVSIKNIRLDFNGDTAYRALAEIKTEKVYRGKCREGATVTVLLPCPIDSGVYQTDADTVSAMREGMTGIFMTVLYGENSVWEQNGAVLCEADIAEYGFPDGVRFAFLETDGGLVFDRDSYKSIADAQTLEEVENYVVMMTDKTE